MTGRRRGYASGPKPPPSRGAAARRAERAAALPGLPIPADPPRRPLTAAEQAQADAMPETGGADTGSLDYWVARKCRERGLAHYHTHDSRESDAGFPDWTIAGPRGHIKREDKTETGELSVDQLWWLGTLHAAGVDVGVWRPRDVLNGRIDDELDAIARPNWQTPAPQPLPGYLTAATPPVPLADEGRAARRAAHLAGRPIKLSCGCRYGQPHTCPTFGPPTQEKP